LKSSQIGDIPSNLATIPSAHTFRVYVAISGGIDTTASRLAAAGRTKLGKVAASSEDSKDDL